MGDTPGGRSAGTTPHGSRADKRRRPALMVRVTVGCLDHGEHCLYLASRDHFAVDAALLLADRLRGDGWDVWVDIMHVEGRWERCT